MIEAPGVFGIKEPLILTVDNGGTDTRLARGREEIGAIGSYRTPQNYEVAIATLAEKTLELLGGERPDAVGLSIAGRIDEGRIVEAGALQEYGWVSRPFLADLAEEMGVKPDRIVMLNDCVAGANAERKVRLNIMAGAFKTLSTG